MLEEIKLRNFKNFDVRDVNFAPGLNLIQGTNGTGKSTIIEAIVFAMFGPRALKADRENTVRWGAVGDATVSLTGELFNDQFTVKRHLGGQVQLNISDGTETKRATDVAKYFGSVFLDLKTFLGTCASYQKDVDRLASQNPAERRDFISRVLCLDLIKDCIDMVGEEVRYLKDVDLNHLQTILNDLKASKEVVKGINLEKVNEAYNLLQELRRVEGKDPLKAKKLFDKTSSRAAKLDSEKTAVTFLREIYERVLLGSLTTCPVCQSELDDEKFRIRIREKLTTILRKEGELSTEISKLRVELIEQQTEAHLRPPEVVQKALVSTGILNPVEAFDSLHQYETLKAQIAVLQRDLPDYKIKRFKEELRQLFRDFREYVLVPYFGVINFVMSEYLTNNTAFTKFMLTENYEIFIDGKPLNSYSGGQVDLICTLFRLAAARVLAELRYGKLPFILLDSFGDALDDNNFSLIVNFLQTQLPNVDQVILTAHHNVSVAGAYRINL